MTEFRVDSYKFLPRSFRPEFEAFPEQPDAVAPARPTVPLRDAKVALLTSAGLYLKDRQPPFDLERERREPWWGDPSYRLIPRDAGRDDLGVAHFHINPDDILEDFDIALPIEVFAELAEQREIGALAENHYSFMGYQGESLAAWQETYGPELAQRLHDESVNYLVLTPVWPDCCRNVPVLARAVEASGIPTVIVTMMPDLAERFHLPRIVGVEFPFGHPFGMPNDRQMQLAVARAALSLYDRRDLPARYDVPIEWPVDLKIAYRSWQPKEIAPIVAYRKQQILARRQAGAD